VGVDAEITFELLRLCEGVEGVEAAPSVPERFSALSWRSGEGTGFKIGVKGAAAGFSGRSAEKRAIECGCDGISGGAGASCIFVKCEPLMPLVGVDEVPAWANGDGLVWPNIEEAPAGIEKGPLVPTAFGFSAFEPKAEAAGGFPKADCVPDVEAKALNGEVVPKGDAEANGLGVGADDDAVAVVVLAKMDVDGSDLGTVNTEVLPNAFGVVARLEKADRAGCGGADDPLNGLEGMGAANGSLKTDNGVGLGPKLLVGHSEPLCPSDNGPLEVV
jgi:hypothetical protein